MRPAIVGLIHCAPREGLLPLDRILGLVAGFFDGIGGVVCRTLNAFTGRGVLSRELIGCVANRYARLLC